MMILKKIPKGDFSSGFNLGTFKDDLIAAKLDGVVDNVDEKVTHVFVSGGTDLNNTSDLKKIDDVVKVHDGTPDADSSLDNLAATTDPTTSDDINAGYSVGSRWINTILNNGFLCTKNNAGAAVWGKVTNVGVVTGQFSHAVSQKPSVTIPVSLLFDTNDITLEGIAHSTSVEPEEFKATLSKSYTFMLAPQWERTTSGMAQTIDFFIQKSTDGGTVFTDVANSNVKVQAGNADSNVIPLMATIAMNVNDIIRFQMRVSSTTDGLGTVFFASEVGPPTIPATPAQILTIFSGD